MAVWVTKQYVLELCTGENHGRLDVSSEEMQGLTKE